MPDATLPELLAQVRYRKELSYFEGLEPLRWRLSKDDSGEALRFLETEFPGLEAPRNAGIAYALAERYRDLGDLPALQRLYAIEDNGVKRSTLNALWDPKTPEMGRGIVEMAVSATEHPDAGVRTEACWVLMNQAGYKSDVAAAVEPLRRLLADPAPSARRQSAYALGHLAKNGKHDLTPHLPGLCRSLTDPDRSVRTAAAWTIWQLSRKRYDIASAVPGLVALLALKDDVGDQYKNAVGALLHHARKSPERADAVAVAVAAADLDRDNKTVRRLLDELTTNRS
ncbi:MAG: HEAT repeat domain-containing protein [Actinomycetota bacterium]